MNESLEDALERADEDLYRHKRQRIINPMLFFNRWNLEVRGMIYI